MNKSGGQPTEPQEKPSADLTISRKEFIRKVLKKGAIAGALLAAPKIIDRFLVPPANAMGKQYTGQNMDTSPTMMRD